MHRYLAQACRRHPQWVALSSVRSLRPAYHCRLRHTSAARPRVPIPRTQPNLVQTRHYAEQIVKVPQMAESITEGTLKQFSKQVGDQVELDEELATIETDKIDVSVNSPAAGVIKEFLVEEEATVTVGQDLIKLDAGASSDSGKDAPSESKDPPPKEQPQEKKPDTESTEKSSEHSLQGKQDQEKAPPQPKKTESKIQKAEDSRPKSADKAKAAQKSDPPKTGGSVGLREENRVKMNRMRLRIAERLKQSQNTAASLTTMNQVDMTAIMGLRKKYKEDILKSKGVKLGFMGAFTRACILAMKDVPTVNASIEGPGGGDTVVWRDYVDVSIAVATEKGLVTPVVRNAESMDIIGIEKAIADLGKKARDNKLTIEDMAGGTFTISNGGVFGSLVGTPIINLPQTAVLGLHAIKDTPTVVNGEIKIRPIMWLALTYDHRLLDGREAVTFLVKVKEYIEDPSRMLLS